MSPAPTRAKRKHTATEWAERFGVTPRTIRNTVAQERSEYLSEAAKRHQRIRELRAEGLSMRAIAAEVNVSVSAVHYALHKSTDED